MTPKLRIGLIAFLASLGLDILTKQMVIANLSYADRIPVIEGFFYLTHVRNSTSPTSGTPGPRSGCSPTRPSAFA
jgi:hypothetical protein